MAGADSVFTGNIPEMYDRFMGPLYFRPFGVELAARLRERDPARILEVAAGTGLVTESLREMLPQSDLTATDLNEAMIAHARRKGIPRVEWAVADAQELPYGDSEFDAVVCQFGVMFFPERKKAFAEAYRVLRPGGIYLFNVWDEISKTRVAEIISDTAGEFFPGDPPLFMRRGPFGHANPAPIEADLRGAGFFNVRHDAITLESQTCGALDVVRGHLEGSPIKAEIDERDGLKLLEIIAAAQRRVTEELGDPVRATMCALVYAAER